MEFLDPEELKIENSPRRQMFFFCGEEPQLVIGPRLTWPI